ncbi:MAG: serine hydrolase [Sporomusaceae bacterium]|nr:serine hydrolase [Sporomusaceae bacterium]
MNTKLTVAVFTTLMLVAVAVLPGTASAGDLLTSKWLADQIKKECKDQTTYHSIYVKDLDSGLYTYLNPMRHKAASLIKVFIMAEAFNQKKQGKLDFSEVVTITKSDQYAWGSLDKVPAGTKVTVGELVEQMIVVSDNTATNLLIPKLGMDNVNALIKKLGCTETVLARRMLDSAAAKAGRENYTSPKDMAIILEKLYNKECVDPESDQKMLDILARQQWNERIPANLPHDLKIAHKTGELGGALHDCGIVFGRQRDYILCMMTKNVPEEHLGYDDNNILIFNDMALISKLIWNLLDDPIYVKD